MDQRERALSEAIQTNNAEKDKWNKYLIENETAIENLEKFSKHVTVDIMVPIGRIALMPGQLIHTNEVLVGHYQNYFTKCSAPKAKEICQLRIKMTQDHLQKLEQEAKLWENKLVKPHTDGVFGDDEKREIIENYNEEEEMKWREQHKLRVRKAKLEERKCREKNAKESNSNGKTDDEIFQMLEQAELMEELQQELDKLEINDINYNVIQQLMHDELSATTKNNNNIQRIPYNNNIKAEGDNENKETKAKHLTDQRNQELLNVENSLENHSEIEKKDATQNNMSDDDEDNDDENEEEEEEIRLIKEQAKYLPATDQVGFYEYQIQIIRHKISRQSTPTTKEEMNEKVRLYMILEQLEELLEMTEGIVSAKELNETDIYSNDDNNVNIANDGVKNDNKKVETKRRVSFALEDDEIEFDKNVAITDMLKSNTLSKSEFNENVNLRRDFIQMKVEENRKFISEQQSERDFNLIDRIVEMTTAKTEGTTTNCLVNTLEIKFAHSHQDNNGKNSNTQEHKQQESYDDVNIGVRMPSDFYDNYLKYLNKTTPIYINSYEGEEDVQVPVLKEADRLKAFEDPKAKFSTPTKSMAQSKLTENTNGNHSNNSFKDKTKSILRNKSAVEKEHYNQSNIWISDNEQNDYDFTFATKKRKKTSNRNMLSANSEDADEEYMTAYYKVMNDVIEKPLTTPDPLPAGNFIDAHAPKRRISRFKEMRQETVATTITRAAAIQQQ